MRAATWVNPPGTRTQGRRPCSARCATLGSPRLWSSIGLGTRIPGPIIPHVLEFVDATDDPDKRVPYPDYVEEFESIGFTQVGRIKAAPTSGTLEDVAAQYGDLADEFLEYTSMPTPILRSPDKSAFVEVSWFWESPSIRLRTRLDDGSLVETLRRWDNPPPAGAMAPYWEETDIDQEMSRMYSSSEGRSVVIVPDCRPDEQWERHREHVSAYSGQRRAQPIVHGDLETAIEVIDEAFRHTEGVHDRFYLLWKVLVWTLAALATIAVGVLGVFSFRSWQAGNPGMAILYALGVVAVISLEIKLGGFGRWVVSNVRGTPRVIRPAFGKPGEETDE